MRRLSEPVRRRSVLAAGFASAAFKAADWSFN
jgi:hypothetical protein